MGVTLDSIVLKAGEQHTEFMALKVLLFACLLLAIFPQRSTAQTPTDAIDQISSAAATNQKVLAAIKASKLNCCDARYEPTCNSLMKAGSSTGGLSVLKLIWNDGSYMTIIPLAIEHTAGNHYSIKETELRQGEGSELWQRRFEDRSQYVEGDALEIEGEHLSFVHPGGKTEVAYVRISDFDITADANSRSYSPPNTCLFQRATFGVGELTDKRETSDYWCYYAEPNPKPNVNLGGEQLCVHPISCRTEFGSQAPQNKTAACRAVDKRCPAATYCFLDPSVAVDDHGKTTLAGPPENSI